ncbi:MAG: hypothetical protein ACRCXC_02900 [Legionella sp.]
MKLKSLLFVLCFGLVGQSLAANVHLNPNANKTDNTKKAAAKATMYPGYCQIEVINESFNDVHVYGTFDDYSRVDFPIYYHEYPHYIDLYYNWDCHPGMFVRIHSRQFPYQVIYDSWTNVNSTVRIVPYLNKGMKVEVQPK